MTVRILRHSGNPALPEAPLFASCGRRERRSLGRLGTTVTVEAGPHSPQKAVR
jgi:hypothetical protein